MGEIKGFVRYNRKEVEHRPVAERVLDFTEHELPISPEELQRQAARCIDCGIPFCHAAGCPIFNEIPEFRFAHHFTPLFRIKFIMEPSLVLLLAKAPSRLLILLYLIISTEEIRIIDGMPTIVARNGAWE